MGPRYAFNNVLILHPELSGPDFAEDIHQLRDWRMNPVLVLHPATSEEFLRRVPEAGELQMVMSENAQDFVGALKAGFFLVKKPCFYVRYGTDNAPLKSMASFAANWSGRLHPNTERFTDFHIAGTPAFGWITSEGLRLLKTLSPHDDLWQKSELRIYTESAGTYAAKTS